MTGQPAFSEPSHPNREAGMDRSQRHHSDRCVRWRKCCGGGGSCGYKERSRQLSGRRYPGTGDPGNSSGRRLQACRGLWNISGKASPLGPAFLSDIRNRRFGFVLEFRRLRGRTHTGESRRGESSGGRYAPEASAYPLQWCSDTGSDGW